MKMIFPVRSGISDVGVKDAIVMQEYEGMLKVVCKKKK